MNRLLIEAIAGILLLGAISAWWMHHNTLEQEKGAQACLAAQQEQSAKDKEQGEQAVKDALSNAQAEAVKQAADAKKASDEEIEKAKQIANANHAKVLDLQKRYEKQLTTDKSCAVWANETVPCALQ